MTNPKTALGSAQVTRRCHECGGTMCGTRQDYQYDECGLTNVRLTNVMIYECKCGNRLPEIPAIMGLHFTIAIALLRKPSLLDGDEIRFLRKMAGLSQVELAEIFGVARTKPSKWESGAVSNQGDKLMRTIFLLGLIQNVAKGKDPSIVKSLAAEKFVRELDVRELFKSISKKKEGPRIVSVENDGSDAWLLNGAEPEYQRELQ